jgi:hypothetical protein
MRRREFVAVLGGSATWPLMARAQQPNARQPRLGILLYSTPRGDPNLASFLRALGELGYVDRQTSTLNTGMRRVDPSGLTISRLSWFVSNLTYYSVSAGT